MNAEDERVHRPEQRAPGRSLPRVWIDLDNTPHVLFFEPLVRVLARRECEITLTAKPHAQTIELLRLRGLTAATLGGSNRKVWLAKVAATLHRALALAAYVENAPPMKLLLTHGSRSGVIAARLRGIPAWTFLDYEHVEARSLLIGTSRFFLPSLLRDASLPQALGRRATFYPGLKENLYLEGWPIDRDGARRAFGISDAQRWVVTRPPAMAAHYASPQSWRMWQRAIHALLDDATVLVDVVPRDAAQGDEIGRLFARRDALRVVRGTHDGPSMIAAADLVVGGGGTMNREGAVLGTPVWSVFSGPTPHIDRCLATEGRLTWIHSDRDLDTALGMLWQRPQPRGGGSAGLEFIADEIWHFLTRGSRSAQTIRVA